MPPDLSPIHEKLQLAITQLQPRAGEPVGVSSTQLAASTGLSLATVKRGLVSLVAAGRLEVSGRARATRYRLLAAGDGFQTGGTPTAAIGVRQPEPDQAGPAWRADSWALRQRLSLPLASRAPVGYQRGFVDAYQPNHSSLLPPKLATELADLSRLPEQLPAGTYIRKVLEQLLIDLSWSSSHLEGNRYNLLDTAELFKSGAPAHDRDSVMLLNHKAAIEFLVDAVPTLGLRGELVRNLHAVLMQDLLADVRALGAIRTQVVNISGTTYVPAQVPAVLGDMFDLILSKARHINNPVEAAFFLWINIAYLQPFEDGNKRVSRLAANIPLMLHNHSPLSFLDLDRTDYALAMMGVYESCDVSMAVDLFDWTYRRSHNKYKVVLEALGAPDPFRIQHREALQLAMQRVVRGRQTASQAMAGLNLPPGAVAPFTQMLAQELASLQPHNCSRFRLSMGEAQAWVDAGRPGL